MNCFKTILLLFIFLAALAWAQLSQFSGVNIEGKPVNGKSLRGQPAVLIVIDIDGRPFLLQWESALKANFAKELTIQPLVIANLTSSKRLRAIYPKKDWGHVWLVNNGSIVSEFKSAEEEVMIFVLGSSAEVLLQLNGVPTDGKIRTIRDTINSVTSMEPQ